MFLDRPAIIGRVDKKKRRVLARTGAFGRKIVKNTVRRRAGKRNESSKPGEPPRRRTGLLYDFVFFGLDGDNTVVIGPKKLEMKADRGLIGKASVPQLLEEGGREVFQRPNGKRVVASYEPRPFIEPSRPTVERFFYKAIEDEPL